MVFGMVIKFETVNELQTCGAYAPLHVNLGQTLSKRWIHH